MLSPNNGVHTHLCCWQGRTEEVLKQKEREILDVLLAAVQKVKGDTGGWVVAGPRGVQGVIDTMAAALRTRPARQTCAQHAVPTRAARYPCHVTPPALLPLLPVCVQPTPGAR